VNGGSQIGFTIQVTNNGSASATGVSISDPLPSAPGLSWSVDPTRTTASNCAISSAGTLSCGPDTLAAGASELVHVTSPSTAATCASSPITNVATASSTNVTGRFPASASVDVLCPSVGDPLLSVTKTSDAKQVPAGGKAGFTVTVSNIGTASAVGVTLDDPLSAANGLTWTIDRQPTSLVCSIQSGHLTCPAITLAPGASYSVHMTSSAAPTNCTQPAIDNTAVASATNAASQQGSVSLPAPTPTPTVAPVAITPAPAPSTPAPSLPFTGFNFFRNVWAGFIALGLGLGLLGLAKPGRRSRRGGRQDPEPENWCS
jgi:uncharacterized repeat protein (TIGR01451 family)